MLSVTLSTLSEYPDLDAVHALRIPLSRYRHCAATERPLEEDREAGHVIFVNIDGEPIALKWIQDGYMDACISQDPVAYGEIAVDMIVKHALKVKLSRWALIKTKILLGVGRDCPRQDRADAHHPRLRDQS